MRTHRLAYPDVARLVGTGLISTGVGLLIFVFITLVWGDPFTYFSERGAQQGLAEQFRTTTAGDGVVAATPTHSLDPRLTCASARSYKRSLASGAAAAELRVPAIGITKYVVKGAGVPELLKGPGIYKETPFPGCGMPVAIAGHRTTHGAPFLNVDKLRPGDRIILTLPYGQFIYRVQRTQIIAKNDWSILNVGAAQPATATQNAWLTSWQRSGSCPTPGGTCEHLVMTACHPKYSARQRIAVFSSLVQVRLRQGRAA